MASSLDPRITASTGPHKLWEADQKAKAQPKERTMQSIQIPTLDSYLAQGYDRTDAREQLERDEADSPAALKAIFDSQGIPEQTLNQAATEFHGRPLSDADTKGYLVEVFAFGKTPIGLYWNNLKSEYETYTSNGKKLSRSPKTKFHAMQGARNEIKSRSAKRKQAASSRAA